MFSLELPHQYQKENHPKLSQIQSCLPLWVVFLLGTHEKVRNSCGKRTISINFETPVPDPGGGKRGTCPPEVTATHTLPPVKKKKKKSPKASLSETLNGSNLASKYGNS